MRQVCVSANRPGKLDRVYAYTALYESIQIFLCVAARDAPSRDSAPSSWGGGPRGAGRDAAPRDAPPRDGPPRDGPPRRFGAAARGDAPADRDAPPRRDGPAAPFRREREAPPPARGGSRW